jgi:hypothetical protein
MYDAIVLATRLSSFPQEEADEILLKLEAIAAMQRARLVLGKLADLLESRNATDA